MLDAIVYLYILAMLSRRALSVTIDSKSCFLTSGSASIFISSFFKSRMVSACFVLVSIRIAGISVSIVSYLSLLRLIITAPMDLTLWNRIKDL